MTRYGGEMKPVFTPMMILALAGCGPAENEPGPGGVTVGEARALDEAAEMIEAKRLPPSEQENQADQGSETE